MIYKTRTYPQFSACGLNCGLCPRYYTDGTSRCPGCAGEGFSDIHPTCGVLSCCQREGLEYCFECGEFPCKKYDGADEKDSFISHRNQFIDIEKANRIGIIAYREELDEKIQMLERLITEYNDGRRKNFYCLTVNLLELADLRDIMEQVCTIEAEIPIKEKAKTAVAVFEKVAARRGISLKMRK